MMVSLKILFAVILITMIVTTSWASMQCELWKIPGTVSGHPWFIATLFDAYFGFLTFYCWVWYKETSFLSRIFWFVAIMLLGNMGMASYMLVKLFKLAPQATVKDLLLRDSKG